jgi:hypothetical protein
MSSGDKPTQAPPVISRLPSFDPNPSAQFGTEVLRDAGAAFALIGRVALWTLAPKVPAEFTKDVDFAVPEHAIEAIKRVLAERGVTARPLNIGGLGIRHENLRVDFIDRHEGGLAPLFSEAIAEAERAGARLPVFDTTVPVVTAEYFLAMKLVSGEDKDEIQALQILRGLPSLDLKKTTDILRRHGGVGSANRLGALARRAGRPDAPPDYSNSG